MGEFAGILLGIAGVVVLVGVFGGGGWVIWKRARVSGRRTYLFLGGALMAIGAYGAVALVVALVRELMP